MPGNGLGVPEEVAPIRGNSGFALGRFQDRLTGSNLLEKTKTT
jgi:hypothetical protein